MFWYGCATRELIPAAALVVSQSKCKAGYEGSGGIAVSTGEPIHCPVAQPVRDLPLPGQSRRCSLDVCQFALCFLRLRDPSSSPFLALFPLRFSSSWVLTGLCTDRRGSKCVYDELRQYVRCIPCSIYVSRAIQLHIPFESFTRSCDRRIRSRLTQGRKLVSGGDTVAAHVGVSPSTLLESHLIHTELTCDHLVWSSSNLLSSFPFVNNLVSDKYCSQF